MSNLGTVVSVRGTQNLQRGAMGNTTMHEAARDGDLEAVERLVEEAWLTKTSDVVNDRDRVSEWSCFAVRC